MKILTTSTFALLICLQSLCLFSQDNTTRTRLHTVPNLHYFGSYFTDLAHTTISPLKWKKKDYYTLGAVGIGTCLLITQDLWIQQSVNSNKTTYTGWMAKNLFEPMGNYQFALGSSVVLYSIGLITHKDRPKQTALLALKAFVVSGAIGQLLKRIGGRRRPYEFKGGDPNAYSWEGFSWKWHSFPSGHTNVAFAVATVIAEMYKDMPIISISAYTMATFAGLSRIHDNAHWASDVFAGAALGWACGRFLVRHNTEKLKISPSVSTASLGVSVRYSF